MIELPELHKFYSHIICSCCRFVLVEVQHYACALNICISPAAEMIGFPGDILGILQCFGSFLRHLKAAKVYDPRSERAYYIRCKNLALNISRDCVSLCLSEDTLKAIGPFYLVSMPGEVKDPTQGVNV